MQRLSTGEIVSPDGLAQVRQCARLQVPDRVHQSTGADGHHRKAQLFESDEDAELRSERVQRLRDESEIVDGVFHSNERRRLRSKLLERIDRDTHRGSARYVVHHPGKIRYLRELQVIRHEAPLGRTYVVRRHDQQGVGASLRRMLGQQPRLTQ